MTAVPPPPKVALDAQTDQALAAFHDRRATLTGVNAELTLTLADGVADQIRAQFGPGNGRIVMAVTQAIGAVEKVMREDVGAPMAPQALLSIAGLAAEQLVREDGEQL